MAFAASKNLNRLSQIQLKPILSRFYSLYEPDYLKALKPKIPIYPTINLQIRGYDFPVVEKYQGFVHKFVDQLDIEVEESWALPPREYHIKKYKPRSTFLDDEYKFNIYERNIQMSNITSITLPILMRILEATLPMGVNIVVDNFDPNKELTRFIPDTDLIKLKDELAETIKNKE
ncbi:uncharacterized protein LOC127290185 [Leptopilina boulardi]|uniref:uncharacterized protein LOC127290185 n=1 Tax=Leptopilina boulardi TaxID=63433 RepID=UPI0021F5C2E0|nr:uncharacterized protein LOC127290185 [Leptopilina boulardi]